MPFNRNENDTDEIFLVIKRCTSFCSRCNLRYDRFNRPIYKDRFTFARVRLSAFVASSKLFFSVFERMAACSKRWSISSMLARPTPNCTSQIGHRAKRHYFLYFYLAGGPCAEGKGMGGPRRESSKNHASREVKCGDPGRASLVPRYFRSATRALEGHNPRA